MSLFHQCRFCKQLFSKAGMHEHIKRLHFWELSIDERVKILGKPPLTSVTTASPRSKRVLSSASPTKKQRPYKNKTSEFLAMPSIGTQSFDARIRIAKNAQRERSFAQAKRNRAISDALVRAPKPRESVLVTKWQEQLAKLAEVQVKVRGDSYALQLQPVLPPQVPPTVDRTKRGAHEEANNSNSKNSVEAVPCSCGGENERCFRCFGTGLEEVSAAEAAKRRQHTLIKSTPGGPASFAKDGVREVGRFGSSPTLDDFGDESFS